MAFIIVSHAAGETTVQIMTKAELKTALDSGSLGETFFANKPKDMKPANWNGKTLIFNGEVITPTPQIRITSWSIT